MDFLNSILGHSGHTEAFTNSQQGFPSGYFKIRSRLNGKCLDVNGGSTQTGTRVVLFDCHDGLNQHWYIDAAGRILNRLSNKTLEVNGGGNSNGTAVQLGNPSGEKNQQWYVDNVGRIKARSGDASLTFDEHNTGQLLPTYMWEDYNSSAQRWYFERIGDSKQTIEIVNDHKLTESLNISNDKLPASDEITIQFWFKMNKFQGGEWKNIYLKGTADWSVRTPGLWIHPDAPRFHVRASTTKDANEGCDPTYTIPEGKWINVAHVLSGKNVKFYVDGKLVRECTLGGFMNPNSEPLRISTNKSDCQIKFMEYSNYALTVDQIEHNMNLKKPGVTGPVAKETEGKLAKPVTAGIKIVNMTSNGSWVSPGGKKPDPECDPFRGQLNQQSAWCAAAAESMKYYLQADFDQIYSVRKILTQGRSTSATQWTTKYAVFYLEPSNDQWMRFGGAFDGNKDPNTIASNNVNFVTKSVRVYPLAWNEFPSIRIGFDGTTKGLSKCAEYLKKSHDSLNDAERKKYLELYNRECRKISYEEHLKKLEEQKKKCEKLYDVAHKYKTSSDASDKVQKELKDQITKLNTQIRKLKLDVELEKSRKCPPQEKCLPMINTPASKPKDINDFDIRTHKEFYKYVLAGSVKKCPPTVNNEQLSKELAACRAHFGQSGGGSGSGEENISKDNSMFMFGGGNIVCDISTTQTTPPIVKQQTPAPVPPVTSKPFSDDMYSIENHKDYKKLMQNYILKSKCAAAATAAAACSSKSCKSLNDYDIKQHKDYPTLIQKCKEFAAAQNNAGATVSAASVATAKANCDMLMAKVRREMLRLRSDITKHPQYEDLMNKYAKRSGTCPPTYAPKTAGDFDIKTHPDIVNYVSKDEVKQLKRELALRLQRASAPGDITQHPDIHKYILKSQLPGQMATQLQMETLQKQLADAKRIIQGLASKCKAQTQTQTPKDQSVASFDITQHPDIHKYILKTQIPDILDKECRKHFKTK